MPSAINKPAATGSGERNTSKMRVYVNNSPIVARMSTGMPVALKKVIELYCRMQSDLPRANPAASRRYVPRQSEGWCPRPDPCNGCGKLPFALSLGTCRSGHRPLRAVPMAALGLQEIFHDLQPIGVFAGGAR